MSGGGVSRPLGSDDLRLIEEDLSKQLSSEMYDRDLELDAEPYISTMENGGEDSQEFVEVIMGMWVCSKWHSTRLHFFAVI